MTIRWRGFYKLQEEMGEVNRILGKLGAFPTGVHPSGENLRSELWDELADLEAAIAYFKMVNKVGGKKYRERYRRKYALFIKWKLSGIDDGQEG